MSWAAVVSGKAHPAAPPPAHRPPPTLPPPSPPSTDPPPPIPSSPNPVAEPPALPNGTDTKSNSHVTPTSAANSTHHRPNSSRRNASAKRQHKSAASVPHSPARSRPHNSSRKGQGGPAANGPPSLWDDPRIVAIYRLWTHHISSFMANPRHFFHFFVINPQFRQSVFEAGLTFHPETDPANPVLINLNSTRFGMSERINALSPPASSDTRTSPAVAAAAAAAAATAAVSSASATSRSSAPSTPQAPVPPLSPIGPDLTLPLHPHLPPLHSANFPFLSPNVSNLFEAAEAVETAVANGDQSALDPFMNVSHPAETFESMPEHDPNHNFIDDILARRFGEATHLEPSDSDSERLSEADVTVTVTNGTRTPKRSPLQNSRREKNAYAYPPERRKAGRRRVMSRVLDIRIPSNPLCKQLSDRAKAELVQQIEETFPKITPPEDYASVREDLLVRLRRIISDEWEGAGIDVYGSAGNGLGLRSADVDMSLDMPEEVARAHGQEKGKADPPKLILARFAAIMEENKMVVLQRVLEARVPVIKMQDPVSKLQIDVCVNNSLAVKNTALLKAYVDLDERFRYVCILVKRWAKRRDLNDAYNGTLSSYAYTLLVIHYLQTLQPPVLPCLQQMVNGKRVPAGSKPPREMTSNGSQKQYNTYYDRTVTPETYKSANHAPVHELLLGFFRYYAYTFRYRTDLVSIRLGTKASRATRNWDEQTVYREWETKQSEYRTAYDAAKAALEARRRADAEERRLREEARANGSASEKATTPEVQTKRERIQFPRRPRLESKHLFCVEDPFDIDHDLSRGMEKSAVTVIRQEMMRAYEIIAETGDFEAACEEWV